ncbi:MAG: hypothetical protein R2732_10335 [Microbacteriaceae bacterium]
MNVTTRTVPAADLLALASLPAGEPTMISVEPAPDSEVVRGVIGASIPTRRTMRRNLPTFDQTPRSARTHLALEGAIS